MLNDAARLGESRAQNVDECRVACDAVHRRVYADLWVQASLDQRQRFQQLFFPDGISFDGNRSIGTGATALAFRYLRPIDGGKVLVDQTGASWNRFQQFLQGIQGLRLAFRPLADH